MVFSALSFGWALEETFWSCSFHTDGRRLLPACSISLLIVAYILEKEKDKKIKPTKQNTNPQQLDRSYNICIAIKCYLGNIIVVLN